MMDRVYNGMPALDLGTEGWAKPWSGDNGGSCVEVMDLADGRYAVRQSENPAGPALLFTEHELDVFVKGWAVGKEMLRR